MIKLLCVSVKWSGERENERWAGARARIAAGSDRDMWSRIWALKRLYEHEIERHHEAAAQNASN